MMPLSIKQEWKYTDPILFSSLNHVPLNIKHENFNENLIEINDDNILCSKSSENIKISKSSKAEIESFFDKGFNEGLSKYTLAGNNYVSLNNNSIFIHATKSEIFHQVRLKINNSKNINADIQIHIYLENDAKLEFIDESHLECNSSIRIFSLINKGSKLNFYRFNKYNPDKVNSFFHFIRANESSVFKDYNFNNGSKQSRVETIVNLDGKKSEFISIGTIISNSTHSDNIVEINHNSHSAISDCFFKAVSKGDSKVIFDGKIFVGNDCSNTTSNQISKGLLMDEKARINLMPKLEINNDDVVCSHGAASGKLDEETLFYLISRGISEDDAKKIYVQGFLSEFIENIENSEMRSKAEQFITQNS